MSNIQSSILQGMSIATALLSQTPTAQHVKDIKAAEREYKSLAAQEEAYVKAAEEAGEEYSAALKKEASEGGLVAGLQRDEKAEALELTRQAVEPGLFDKLSEASRKKFAANPSEKAFQELAKEQERIRSSRATVEMATDPRFHEIFMEPINEENIPEIIKRSRLGTIIESGEKEITKSKKNVKNRTSKRRKAGGNK